MDKYEDILFSFLYRDEEFPAVKNSKGFSWMKILRVTYNSIKEEIEGLFKSNNKIIKEKIWLYVESINQLKALEAINQIEKSILVTSSQKLIENSTNVSLIKIHLNTKLLNRIIRLFHFPAYKTLFGHKFRDHLATIIKYDGLYESLIDLLKQHQPKMIVFSNDHNAFCRALMIAAKDLNIKTVYIQHAAVTNRFPPLKFDLSLLEGQDSLDKYSEAGIIEGDVALVGMLKFDRYFDKINMNDRLCTIGLALNAGDDFQSYFKLFCKLKANFKNFNFHIRFHPSIDINKINIPNYFIISNILTENSFDFLSQIDLLFAGDSSIHLEASLLNIPSYQLRFNNQKINDYYNFVMNNLVEIVEIKDIKILIDELKTKKINVRQRAKYYNSAIDSHFDGNTLSEVIKHINKLI